MEIRNDIELDIRNPIAENNLGRNLFKRQANKKTSPVFSKSCESALPMAEARNNSNDELVGGDFLNDSHERIDQDEAQKQVKKNFF